MLMRYEPQSANKMPGRTFLQRQTARTRSASVRTSNKARNLIERFFNKIKQYRRIATRYDKLAENFLAALKLVAVRIWIRDL